MAALCTRGEAAQCYASIETNGKTANFKYIVSRKADIWSAKKFVLSLSMMGNFKSDII